MDAGLRRHFLAMLDVDLEMTETLQFAGQDEGLIASVLIGPLGFERVEREWLRHGWLYQAIATLTTKAEQQVEEFEGGGIISCDCWCHRPIGAFVSMTDCVHCRRLAAA